jgi:hypothetical protein
METIMAANGIVTETKASTPSDPVHGLNDVSLEHCYLDTLLTAIEATLEESSRSADRYFEPLSFMRDQAKHAVALVAIAQEHLKTASKTLNASHAGIMKSAHLQPEAH